jgi:APA family basic amino acid/polyamine antiporter
MVALPKDTWARLIVWMAIGLAIYVFYGRKHSKLNS